MEIINNKLLQDKNCLDIWQFPQNLPDLNSCLQNLLSLDEMERANKYRYGKDRLRFTSRRGFLRLILGNYLGLCPKNINLAYTEYGKPYLHRSEVPLKFSISSSDQYALLAITSVEVGIDIEKTTFIENIDEISKQVVPRSISFNTLSQCEKMELFYKWWTRKEAYQKAKGTGLLQLQNGIENGCCLDSLFIFDGICWKLLDIPSPANYASAVCLACDWEYIRLRYWKFSLENTGLSSIEHFLNSFILFKEETIIVA